MQFAWAHQDGLDRSHAGYRSYKRIERRMNDLPNRAKYAQPGCGTLHQAHEPNETNSFDFCQQLCNMLILIIANATIEGSRIEPSSMASTYLYFASIATGQDNLKIGI